MAAKKPRYEWNGIPIQSVTEVLSMLNKPALVPWATKLTAEYIESIVNKTDDLNALDWPVILKDAKSAHRTASREAMDKGTAVHAAIDSWIESGGIMSPDEIANEDVKRGLQAFLDYGEAVDLEIIENEQQIFGWTIDVDRETTPPLYAGRFDLLCKLNGVLTMADFKVAKDIYPEYWLQLEAYAAARERQEESYRIEQIAIFRIDKETGILHPEIKERNHERFMAFWHLANARQIIQKEGVK